METSREKATGLGIVLNPTLGDPLLIFVMAAEAATQAGLTFLEMTTVETAEMRLRLAGRRDRLLPRVAAFAAMTTL